jgi:hypothetical protein
LEHLKLLLLIITFPIHFYFLIRKQFDEEIIWSVNASQVKILRYHSSIKIVQDLSLLFMVLNGSISFVGSQIMSSKNNNPKLIVKPGITGLPHLKTANIDMEHIRKFENYYAMHHSLIFDIEILLKSIFKI